LAPEVFERKGHNQSVDFWALGILIFELLAGEQPFRGRSPDEIFEAIQQSKENGLNFPKKTFSPNAKFVQILEINLWPF
jgi:protein kinase X